MRSTRLESSEEADRLWSEEYEAAGVETDEYGVGEQTKRH